jgi:hypothetical protein
MNLQENIHRIKNVMGLMNESTTSHYRKFYDEDEVNIFEKILNKSMKKYDWWKDIKIDLLSYDERTKRLNIVGVLSVDEEWGANQWMSLYDTKLFNSNEYITLSEIVDDKFAYILRDEIGDLFEFTFNESVDSLSINSFELKFIPTEDIQESFTYDKQKDLSPMIRESLNTIIESNGDRVCDIEVTAPWKRETVEPDKSFKHYKVLVKFIGGYGTKYFPTTQAVISKYYDIIDEIWDTIYGYLNLPTDIYSKTVKSCDEGKKEEETEGVGAYAAPAFEMKPDHVHFKHQYNEGELTEKCWKGYTQKGMKTMFGKRYPNCVKKTK